MKKRYLFVTGIAVCVVTALACGGGDFDSSSKVESVRMFGVIADKPYANPGDTVTLTALTTDGRPTKPLPLKTFWIPAVCINPSQDEYYACFFPSTGVPGFDGGATLEAPFPTEAGTGAGGGDGGTGILGEIPENTDLSAFLPQGDTFKFQLPQDIIQPRSGSSPYGLALVFNIACAGEVRFAGRSGNNPQQVPILCTDANGKQLTPNDYVIGINRVYSYADKTNTNPVIQGLTLNGAPVDPKAGLTIDHCVASRRSDCKEWKIDVQVPESSWEANPGQNAASQNQREQIWVDYYSDLGDLEDDARLLYDTTTGRVSASDVKYRAPYAIGEGTVWLVVHDNRAGAAFMAVPLHIK